MRVLVIALLILRVQELSAALVGLDATLVAQLLEQLDQHLSVAFSSLQLQPRQILVRLQHQANLPMSVNTQGAMTYPEFEQQVVLRH